MKKKTKTKQKIKYVKVLKKVIHKVYLIPFQLGLKKILEII